MHGIREADSQNAMRALTWLFYTPRPMAMEELRHALLINDVDEDLGITHGTDLLADDIVECCPSLVIHEKSSGIVRFTHVTVQTFLESETLLPIGELAKNCITYLNLRAFKNGPWSIEGTVAKLVEKYKFCPYAARYWAIFAKGNSEDSPELQKAIFQLMKSRRDSIAQIDFYSRNIPISLYTTNRAIIHVIAEKGLAYICKSILSRKSGPSELYTDSMNVD